ncbi:MAG: aspartate kinase [Oscillospiraceae bacterium]|nr:aspartate kinase [Oscillospiraceae bacterium]
MMLTVQKFGGTSVADAERIRYAAGIVSHTYDKGYDVVVVVSAQGDTTDVLLEKAAELSCAPGPRELDMLLTTGEQMSAALMAMCLEEMGYPAISLTGWQAGVETTAVHGDARILRIDTARLLRELHRGRIVIVAGFQGISAQGEITTLGRGGSDTTAVALAAALGADRCEIFTDVDGVYTADPRKFSHAVKLKEISYDNMLAMARNGAQVLHDRCVELAKEHGIVLEVRSAFTDAEGTIIGEKREG